MLDISKYVNNLPIVKQSQFTTIHIYSNGQCVETHDGSQMTISQYEALLSRLRVRPMPHEKIVDEQAYSLAKQVYNQHTKNLLAQFRQDTLDYYSMENNQLSTAMYDKAYGEHGRDLQSVFHAMNDYSDLYEIAKQTFATKS